MLRLALSFEIRLLLRSRAAQVALVAFLAIGSLSIFSAHRYSAQWEDAVETARAAQQELIAETRGYLEAGKGPEDRPWVDFSQPLWQDWYSGTRVVRTPNAMAGMASGAVDSAPAVFKVYRTANPLAAGGYRIENPELTVGAVDFVFVIGILLPLLVAVLGLNVGSRERETHLDQLIAVQAGSLSGWLLNRMIAVAIVAAVAVIVLCLLFAGVVGAALGATLALITIGMIYTALWSGLLLAINSKANSVSNAAFGFGAAWTVLCVLLPTLASETALTRVQTDYALSETLDARGARYDIYDQELSDVLPLLYRAYPGLTTRAAAANESLDNTVARHAYDGLLLLMLEERNRQRREDELKASHVGMAATWMSPTVALALALERLAGVGPDAASGYRDYLVSAVMTRGEWVLEQAWDEQPLDQQDYEALISSAPSAYEATAGDLSTPVLALAVWMVAAWLFVGLRLRARSL